MTFQELLQLFFVHRELEVVFNAGDKKLWFDLITIEGEKLTEYLDSVKEPQTAFADAFNQAQGIASSSEETVKKDEEN